MGTGAEHPALIRWYQEARARWESYRGGLVWRQLEYVPMRVRGGFRTRYRVRWARVLLAMLRNVREGLRVHLEVVTDAQVEADRQRYCPHPAGLSDQVNDEWAVCRACGAGLPVGS